MVNRRTLTVISFLALSTLELCQAEPFRDTVSVDVLRNPVPPKARIMIDKAQQLSAEGKHQAAIEQLIDTMKKYPLAAARAQSFLGFEYIQTEQYWEAVRALREAVRLLPHDAINHSNLGLSLAAAGEISAAIIEV